MKGGERAPGNRGNEGAGTSPLESMHHEFELKLALAPEQLEQLPRNPLLCSLARGKPAIRELVSTYYDTPARLLYKRAMALRVRAAGAERIQTLKVPGHGATGLQHFCEYETPLNGERPDLGRLADEDIRSFFERERVADTIEPVFTTHFARQVMRLRLVDSEIELALDRGEIRSGEASEPICEAELELISGNRARIYELALALHDSVPFRVERRSKAGRGYDLAMHRGPAPMIGEKPRLQPGMTLGDAVGRIVRTCQAQIEGNEAAVLAGHDPEGIHQMRVGVRRLRAALQVFRPVVTPAVYDTLKEELRWLQKQLGPARDWDVFVTETLPPIEEHLPEEHGFEALAAQAERARAKAYEAARAVLAAPRYTALILRLDLWLEEGSFVARPDEKIGDIAGNAVEDFAAKVLSKYHKKLRKLGRKHDGFDEAELHDLRIQTKKTRYAVEFFRSLYPEKPVKRYLRTLVGMQDALGAFNDAAATRGLLEELRLRAALGGGYDKPLGERVTGLITGWQAARAADDLRQFAQIWRRVEKAEPFWTA